jgi:hypothetical protein
MVVQGVQWGLGLVEECLCVTLSPLLVPGIEEAPGGGWNWVHSGDPMG